MASATDADPREVEFRRRWYEAHARRARADIDQGQFKDWLPGFWSAGAEALKIRNRLASSGDLERFRADLLAWAIENDVGFKGPAGGMFINSLVKNTYDPATSARMLVNGLTLPSDRESAATKIDALVNHIDHIKVGAKPAPLSAAFVLSYFWALEQPRQWPIFWPNDRKFLAASTGTKLSGSPTERYLEFVDLVAALDEDCERFARVSSWWAEKRAQPPVFLDPVLVDRCAYGRDREAIPPESHRDNARSLVAIARYLAEALVMDVSGALGSSCEAVEPPMDWKSGRPRSDLWAVWRPERSGPAFRLWVNERGAAIGIIPGLASQVRPGWYNEARAIIAAHEVEGFTLMAARGASQGEEMGFLGETGGFIYGRWYEADQLADLDLRAEVVDVALAAGPLLDALTSRARGDNPPNAPPTPDPLAGAVEEFRRDTGYPAAEDEKQRAHQSRLRELLLTENAEVTGPSQLRRIWISPDYGHPGMQQHLDLAVNAADDAEYQRILNTLDYLCWGDDDDAERINNVLKNPVYRVRGLGEAVSLKLLAICHPDRYLCVYPYSGEQGKLRMLKALHLPEPPKEATRGHKHVESNDRLWERLEPFFPEDPWGMMCFLYWYLDWEGPGTPGNTGEGQARDPIDTAAADLLIGRSFLDDIVGLLEDKGQVILYGPPGTGKTFLAQRLAKALAPRTEDRTLVQFHPSTSYEDFFEGYRPEEGSDGQIVYRLTQGPLARMAERAARHPQRPQVMVIDEINRANLPKVLGELLFLFEYRDKSISTLYRPEGEFELPESLWFIGTMNTADRSIALVDAALRRRFHFVPFFPDRGPTEGLLERWLDREGQPSWVGELLAMVNKELTDAIGAELQLGPSHFMKQGYLQEPDTDDTRLRRIWEYNIEPLIEDQLFGDPDRIERFRFENVVARYRSSSGLGDSPADSEATGDRSDPDV